MDRRDKPGDDTLFCNQDFELNVMPLENGMTPVEANAYQTTLKRPDSAP